MKAVVVEQYAPIDQIELKEIYPPVMEPGQLRIRVEAAGIGFVDGLKIEGRYQTKDPLPSFPGPSSQAWCRKLPAGRAAINPACA